ncbi:hypothetical protein ALP90_200103 [Pseudomonas amygdali pv. ulmi]|uniref:Uncharacterized protein n=1 Tax=Pseudomonas amygdali pv. ulmi TaxID=251720 RepID=A0A3M4SPK6_PSEA0|nr:hypothetical protein ALP90_200103 [Pseudomonas amygdali pv. ulmi]
MPVKSKIEPFDHLLGEVHDYVIAEMAGTLPAAVCKRRTKKGIDTYPRHVLKRYAPLLGKQSDTSISAVCGVPAVTVCAYRRELGIARFSGPYKTRLSAFDALLDLMSNAQLGRLAGGTREGIRGRRLARARRDARRT